MIDPPEGSVGSHRLDPAVRRKSWFSSPVDVSAASLDEAGPYSADHEIAIEAVYLHYLAAGSGTAAELNVGSFADQDAIVGAHPISNTALDGDVETPTLAATLRASAGLGQGSPVMPKGTQMRVTTTSQGTNTAVVQVQIVYSELTAGL